MEKNIAVIMFMKLVNLSVFKLSLIKWIVMYKKTGQGQRLGRGGVIHQQ